MAKLHEFIKKTKIDGSNSIPPTPWNEIKQQLHRSENCQCLKSSRCHKEGSSLTLGGVSSQTPKLPTMPRAS